MRARLVILSTLALAMACDGTREPTAPASRGRSSDVISDGAHGGANKDFFFLPPLLPSPTTDPNFDAGKFNSGLRPSLQVQICELGANNLSAQGRPTDATTCTSAPPIATFAPGSVQLVSSPRSQIGWWTLFNLPADGFYYVLWDTHATNRLDASKYYRIKVSISGVPEVLGYADVDPIQNLTQWKNALTGEVIQMVNGTILPIPFRVENGEFCGGVTVCTSATVTNNSATPQIIQVQGNNGPIAGVKIPEGKWLPDGGPQSVVFTIKQVNTGVNDQAAGTQANPCHQVPIQQFNGCFNFTTIPTLDVIPGTTADKFLKDLTVAVCFVLADQLPLDQREPWVQLWSSDVAENEAPRPLPSAYSGDILSVHSEENCGTNYLPVITSNESGVRGLASAGWRALRGGLGEFFGIKTAYAVDLGLGGLTKGTSNIGPGLTAKIIANTSTALSLTTVEAATPQTVRARLVGTQVHNGQPLGDVTLTGNTRGIPGLPVTFTVADGNGTLSPFGAGGPTSLQITTTSSPILDTSLSGGLGTVSWNFPIDATTGRAIPGTYTLKADGPAIGGPITYTAIVADIGFNVTQGSLTAGGPYNCAIRSAGAAYCWGYNGTGALGDGTTTSRTTPAPVAGGNTFESLSAGAQHTCGLTTAGAAYCWGANPDGEVGDGTTTARTSPVAVGGGLTFASVTAGGFHNCGLTASGAAYCWGLNTYGEVGDGTTTSRTLPVAVASDLTFVTLVAGFYHTCGLTTGGVAYCWGYNGAGSLGDGTLVGHHTPAAVATDIRFASLAAGGYHMCGLTVTGAAYCWGDGSLGQLGNGGTSASTTPVSVAEFTFSSLALGGWHSCGVTTGGAAYCWGYNDLGALGDGTQTNRATPVGVAGNIAFASLAGGELHTCGVSTAGAVYCWGNNGNGELGDGTVISKLVPIAVASP